ncbi:MAG: hypothetical protein H6741_32880 [Alphaproteobacteria bacterium]|nr:hypothetical protein [Alphaproteobacteria bacterium]MCB9797511.1 hypothetical protein [Alphaproteobacteria bacterium]
MSRLLDQALLGGVPSAEGADPEIAPLVGARPEPEWRLLLRAGAEACHRRAGRRPDPAPPATPPAAEDPRAPCSTAAEALLSELLESGQLTLLAEACALLVAADQRLPHPLLPLALNQRAPAAQASLRRVLGPRARWLAAYNPAWAWILDDTKSETPVLLERWAEGDTEQRCEALEALRRVAPAEGLAALRATWDQENAETRRALLRALRVGLSLDDEPFLELALDDRGARVRQLAAELLRRLPRSRLVDRMRSRATHHLRLHAARKGVLGRLTGQRDQLEVLLPERYSKDYERDGVAEPGELGLGPRRWWLVQLLAAVPPSHWSTRFERSPERLLELIPAAEWAVVEGWSRAATALTEPAWLLPLWRWWRAQESAQAVPRPRVEHWLDELLRCLPQEQAEATAQSLLRAPALSEASRLASLLEGLPRPWSEGLGRAWLRALRADLDQPGAARELRWWELSVSDAAAALPPILLDEAQLPLPDDLELRRWRSQLVQFNDTLDLRRRLIEEIRP